MKKNHVEILKALQDEGAEKILLVGGAARDLIFLESHAEDYKPTDYDFEIYGMSPHKLKTILSKFGRVKECGQQFGVFKLATPDKREFDFSIPRKDSKVSPGHKGFVCDYDPNLSIKEACARRNFTMNAMGIDPLTGELHDFFDGKKHILERALAITDSNRYIEDLLRNLIGLQLCCRYNVFPLYADKSVYLRALEEFYTLPGSRIWKEWRKLFEKGKHFIGFFKALEIFGLDGTYPELAGLINLSQDPEWHPEGTADVHSELAAEWAANYCDKEGIEGEDRLVLVCAALLHDIGKPMTTTHDTDGRIRAKGHPEAAVDIDGPATKFFEKINMPLHIRARVAPLIKEHMVHLGGNLSKAGVRRLARRLDPATIYELDIVIQADHASRPPLDSRHPCPNLVNMAVELEIVDSKPKPILLGRHLIPLGVKPGPEMGVLIKDAFERQLDGEFDTVEAALSCMKEHIEKAIGGSNGKGNL